MTAPTRHAPTRDARDTRETRATRSTGARPAHATGTASRTPAGARAHTATRTKPQYDRAKPRTREAPPPQSARNRSMAAERAYARRAQRSARAGGAPRPGTPERVARAPFVVLVMSLLIAGVATTLWLSTQATADSYRLERAKQEAGTLAEQVEQMQADVAKEQSPAALARRAHDLGMVPAGDPARLVLGADGRVRVVGTPQRAQAPKPVPPPSRPAQVSGPRTPGDTASPPSTTDNPRDGAADQHSRRGDDRRDTGNHDTRQNRTPRHAATTDRTN